jgi:hypothetical protein
LNGVVIGNGKVMIPLVLKVVVGDDLIGDQNYTPAIPYYKPL